MRLIKRTDPMETVRGTGECLIEFNKVSFLLKTTERSRVAREVFQAEGTSARKGSLASRGSIVG